MTGGPEWNDDGRIDRERIDVKLPCAVILAAGASSRLGEPKALAQIGKHRVIDRISATLREHLTRRIDTTTLRPARPTLIVTGAHDAPIRDHLQALAAPEEVLFNARWQSGRTGSVQAAVLARPGSALLIWPSDVPLVKGATVRSIVSKWDELKAPVHGWLAPRLSPPVRREAVDSSPGESARPAFGHPILIGPALALRALQMTPLDPLRRLRRFASPLAAVDVNDEAILDDLDTPEDLEALRARVASER